MNYLARYELKGHWYTPNDLSELSGIPAHTIRDRLRRGFTVEEAIKDIPTHDSVKDFCEASYYEDWIGMSIENLHNIYYKWCIQHGFTPLQKQGFSRQIMKIYPMLKTVPTTKNNMCARIIRMRN